MRRKEKGRKAGEKGRKKLKGKEKKTEVGSARK